MKNHDTSTAHARNPFERTPDPVFQLVRDAPRSEVEEIIKALTDFANTLEELGGPTRRSAIGPGRTGLTEEAITTWLKKSHNPSPLPHRLIDDKFRALHATTFPQLVKWAKDNPGVESAQRIIWADRQIARLMANMVSAQVNRKWSVIREGQSRHVNFASYAKEIRDAANLLTEALDETRNGGASCVQPIQTAEDTSGDKLAVRDSGRGLEPSAAADTPAEHLAEPDEKGYVVQPADPSAFVPAAEIVSNYAPKEMPLTSKRLTQILENYPEARVRWTRPPGKNGKARHNRRSVHLTDWNEYVKRFRRGGGLAKGEDDWPEVSENGIAKQKEAIRRSKSAGQ